MGTPVLIGLGSNLGDRKTILDTAFSALAATPSVEVRSASSHHETAPVGGPPGQGPFLNAAALLETTLEPLGLLDVLQEIERGAGRERRVRWGERTLDLDILLFGDRVIGRPCPFTLGWHRPEVPLQVPHPQLPFRRFVLAPAAEIAAGWIDPITRLSIYSLLANLDRRPSYVALSLGGMEPTSRRAIFRLLTDSLSAAGLSEGLWPHRDPSPLDPHAPATDRAGDLAIEARGHDLRIRRWSEELWDDRWIISDDWFDLTPPPGGGVPPLRFSEIRREVLQPTFVVLSGPDHEALASAIASGRFEDVGGWPIGGSSPPIYVPESTHPEAFVSEILTQCSATRSGPDNT